MTDEQIYKLAETCGFITTGNDELWMGWNDELLKFALAIHENGYNKGFEEGHYMGFEYRDSFDKGYANGNPA